MKKTAYRRPLSVIWIVSCVLLCSGLTGCFWKSAAAPKYENSENTEGGIGQGGNQSYVENELIGIFDTEEEADAAAELYGIELMSYGNQVAVFRCECDPDELIGQGEANGWPQLSLNHRFQAFGEERNTEKREP